ncbi:MAG: hypothetical protein V8T33_07035 [Parabacteroides distasonis]
MNFNRYLNRFRLRELDRLRSHPANQGKSVSSLIGQVGFKDFRTYSLPSSPSGKRPPGSGSPRRKEARHDEPWSYGGFRFQSSHRLRHGMYGMMLLDACRYGRGGQERRLRALLALTYLVTSLGWLGLVLYSVARALSLLPSRLLLTLMLDQVMFFWVVSMITDTASGGG